MANEGRAAVDFTRAVLRQCSGFRKVVFHAVFDRVTRDSSIDLMRQLAENEPGVEVEWVANGQCVVDAYVYGYRQALSSGADWILEIDAGFSHQPEDIPQFFDHMEKGFDCVFGSRFMPGGSITDSSKIRHFISKGGTLLTNVLLQTRQTDMTSGFELFSRDTLQMVLDRGIQSKAHFFQTEIRTHCQKLRYAEVPIRYRAASPRVGSASIKEAFRQLWRLYKLKRAGEL